MNGLIVFAKKPLLGNVKTRLQPEISPELSLEIYRSFVEDTLEKVAGFPETRVWLGCYPDADDPWFRELSIKYKIQLFNQEGENLGERMERAFRKLEKEPIQFKVIIGTDTPHLPANYISEAFCYLKSYPVVIGPSRDGGYYLLGIAGSLPPIFDDIRWSTDTVFKSTTRKLEEKKISYYVLPEWFDIDNFKDLLHLKGHLLDLETNKSPVPKRTRLILNSVERKDKRN